MRGVRVAFPLAPKSPAHCSHAGRRNGVGGMSEAMCTWGCSTAPLSRCQLVILFVGETYRHAALTRHPRDIKSPKTKPSGGLPAPGCAPGFRRAVPLCYAGSPTPPGGGQLGASHAFGVTPCTPPSAPKIHNYVFLDRKHIPNANADRGGNPSKWPNPTIPGLGTPWCRG